MLRDIIGQRQDAPDPGKHPRSKSAVAASEFESVAAQPEPPPASELMPSDSPGIASHHPAPGQRNGFSSDVSIKGSLQCAGDLVLDGQVDGEVHVGGQLSIGENGCVIGDVRARTAIVFGRIQGNVFAEDHCEVRANAAIVGDICAGSLSIEEGAAFNGRSAVGASRSSPAIEAPSATDDSRHRESDG